MDALRQALARQRANLADALAVNALRAHLLALMPREGEVLPDLPPEGSRNPLYELD